MASSEITFDDGARTMLEVWGDGGPLVLGVHGMTSSRKSWTRLAERLDGRCRVAAYDQRGHGDAAAVRGPMTLARQVADLETVVQTLGADVLAIVGHSWGGAVAILAGRRTPARRIIAIDPVLRVLPHTWQHDYLDDAVALFALPKAARELSIRSSLAGWHPVDVDAKLHAVARMTAEPIAKLGAENRVDEGGWDLIEAIASYPKPLLVFAAGPDDSVMSADDLARLKKDGGAHVRVAEFASEGHNLHRTAFDAFAAEVESFLGV
jgi:pimeloyl-ACP methyl ester carboxylesterase